MVLPQEWLKNNDYNMSSREMYIKQVQTQILPIGVVYVCYVHMYVHVDCCITFVASHELHCYFSSQQTRTL